VPTEPDEIEARMRSRSKTVHSGNGGNGGNGASKNAARRRPARPSKNRLLGELPV
jgi:hypothetical protein